MEQKHSDYQAHTGDAVSQLNTNAMNSQDLSHLSNGFIHPDSMTGIMQAQPFISDPSMAGLPMPDASLILPLIMAANGSAPASAHPNAISAEDIALYDRQIRLWGMAAQAKIQSANILLITIKALANEIAKNLVLAGVGSLTVLDDGLVSEADLGAQFFLSEDDNLIGQNRSQAACPAIQRLNPRVRVHVDAEGVKSKGPSYFGSFDIVIATDLDPESFNLINTATRINGTKFYAASTYGMYGFIFSDLIEHNYVIERDVGNVATQLKQESRTRAVIDVKTKKEGTKDIESVTKRELYSTWFLASDMAVLPSDYLKSKRRLKSVSPALSCLRALWEFMQTNGGRSPGNREDLKLFTQIATTKHRMLGLPSETLSSEFLRSFLQNLGSEIAPVTAILGGQLAQDVINVLGQKEQPIQNMVIFDGTSMEALMYPLHPEGTLGALQLLTADPMMGNGAPGGDMMMAAGMGMGMGMGFDPSAMAGLPMSDFGMGGMMPPMGDMSGQIPGLGNGTAAQDVSTQSQITNTNTTITQPQDITRETRPANATLEAKPHDELPAPQSDITTEVAKEHSNNEEAAKESS